MGFGYLELPFCGHKDWSRHADHCKACKGEHSLAELESSSDAARPCRRFITLADLRKFLPMQHARSALQFLDTDGDGRISLADMREAVQGICLQRK